MLCLQDFSSRDSDSAAQHITWREHCTFLRREGPKLASGLLPPLLPGCSEKPLPDPWNQWNALFCLLDEENGVQRRVAQGYSRRELNSSFPHLCLLHKWVSGEPTPRLYHQRYMPQISITLAPSSHQNWYINGIFIVIYNDKTMKAKWSYF